MKLVGRWVYMYRAIDQHGQLIDVLASPKRDLAATRLFFARALNAARRVGAENRVTVPDQRLPGWRTWPPGVRTSPA